MIEPDWSSNCGRVELYLGDSLKIMPILDPVETCLTDPPYGINFMSKTWDHGVPGKPFWQSLQLLPGAMLLAFGGTRTFHRLTCAIEDSGFEIRDCMQYLYGSGFPKSLDISKAIDKQAGAEREVVGKKKKLQSYGANEVYGQGPPKGGEMVITAPATSQAKTWNGYGTALKPSFESIICATKPLDLQALCGILAHKIGGSICQLQSNVSAAEKTSASSQRGQDGEFDFAQWRAVPRFNSLGDLLEAMDTLRLGSDLPSCLNTALSWLNTLGAILTLKNTFTTETETGLITDLKTLNSTQSAITPESIVESATQKHGTASSVCLAGSIFNVVKAKLENTLTPSAQGIVTSTGDVLGLSPSWEPIILAMKPLDGTFANNALVHGVGGLWIDGGRVGTEGATTRSHQAEYSESGWRTGHSSQALPQGRWPANTIHDGSDEVLAGMPENGRNEIRDFSKCNATSIFAGKGRRGFTIGDQGTAARFFYCAKAAKKERGEYNKHPTVKPLALMRYLAKLTRTPTGGTVIDPFMGSGSTGVACYQVGRKFIGIEKDPESFETAVKRLKAIIAVNGRIDVDPVEAEEIDPSQRELF